MKLLDIIKSLFNHTKSLSIHRKSFMIFKNTYTVQKGDYLLKIANGDRDLCYKIYKANRNIIKDPNLIYVGQVLTMPYDLRKNVICSLTSRPCIKDTYDNNCDGCIICEYYNK